MRHTRITISVVAALGGGLPLTAATLGLLAACDSKGSEAAQALTPATAGTGSGGVAGARPTGAPGAAGVAAPGPDSRGAGGADHAAMGGRPAASPMTAGQPVVPPSTAGSAAAGPAMVMLEVEASALVTTGLESPTDLEWNPYADGELWIVNRGDSSTTIVSNATSEEPTVQRRLDPEASRHFMPSPMGLAFGRRETSLVDAQGQPVEGTFATCPGSRQEYMGPTLWTSDLRIFAIAKREREPPFNGPDTGAEGPGSHLDMLHRTPGCTGIAWEGAGSVYWTYSSSHAMFVKYDFAQDHGIGNTDHSDGSVWRYPVASIQPVADVPSHLVYHAASKRVFMVDTGGARVVTFAPDSAVQASAMSSSDNVDRLAVAMDMRGGQVTELISSAHGLMKPSGVEIHEDRLYVSDNQTGVIHRFSLDGRPLGKAVITNVERGALAGLDFGPDGKLYFTDMVGGRVLRLDAAF